jgi:hypothetical protein
MYLSTFLFTYLHYNKSVLIHQVISLVPLN